MDCDKDESDKAYSNQVDDVLASHRALLQDIDPHADITSAYSELPMSDGHRNVDKLNSNHIPRAFGHDAFLCSKAHHPSHGHNNAFYHDKNESSVKFSGSADIKDPTSNAVPNSTNEQGPEIPSSSPFSSKASSQGDLLDFTEASNVNNREKFDQGKSASTGVLDGSNTDIETPRAHTDEKPQRARWSRPMDSMASRFKDFVVKTSTSVASSASVQLSKIKQSAVESTASASVQLKKLKESTGSSSIAAHGKLQLVKLKESLSKGKAHAVGLFNKSFRRQSVESSKPELPNHMKSSPRRNSLTQPKFMEQRDNVFNTDETSAAAMPEYSALATEHTGKVPLIDPFSPLAPDSLIQSAPCAPAPPDVNATVVSAHGSTKTPNVNATACKAEKRNKDGAFMVKRKSRWKDDICQSVFTPNMADLMTPQEQYDRVAYSGPLGTATRYKFIRSRPIIGTFGISKLDVHREKNRYTNILCYDHTRVNLLPLNHDPHSYYINANYVDGYQQKHAYICCQGPLENTCKDFWRMIWQEEVTTIAMITKLVENHRAKCFAYWPLRKGKLLFGHLAVINKEVVDEAGWMVTKLVIKNTQTGEQKKLVHLLFSAWPDYGIPSSTEDYLQFLLAVKQYQAMSIKDMGKRWQGHPKGPPIVVHCSAGVGRTGTFVVTDVCIDMIDDIQKLNIEKVLELVREQRTQSIQTAEQFIFCHLALLEYAKQRGYINSDIMALLGEPEV